MSEAGRQYLGLQALNDWQRFALTLVFNTLIGLGLTLVGYGGGLVTNLLFSQALGLSIFFAVTPALRPGLSPARRGILLGLGLVLGSVVGTLAALFLTGLMPEDGLFSGIFLRNLLLGLAFGLIVTYFFLTREWLRQARNELHQSELRDLRAQKLQLETELRLLQAQVEPHFLFNTLAHLMSLIDSDTARAREMLGHLIDYLRTSLQHSRQQRTALRHELSVVQSYLSILRLRLGDRLRCHFEVPKALEEREVPPMLLQPLVENAIKHGLEPRVGEGKLWIRASESDGAFHLSVTDDGAGFGAANAGLGEGIRNLRARLRAFYGHRAALQLQERPGGGVQAVISIEGER